MKGTKRPDIVVGGIYNSQENTGKFSVVEVVSLTVEDPRILIQAPQGAICKVRIIGDRDGYPEFVYVYNNSLIELTEFEKALYERS